MDQIVSLDLRIAGFKCITWFFRRSFPFFVENIFYARNSSHSQQASRTVDQKTKRDRFDWAGGGGIVAFVALIGWGLKTGKDFDQSITRSWLINN